MSFMDYKPNEVIVNRAVELWIKMLSNPKYDNGDKSEVGLFGMALAHQLPNNSTPEILDKFGSFLKEKLMNKGKIFYVTSLDVDYGPCEELKESAEKAGLATMFPYKTHMSLTERYVTIACGYAAPFIYHYPLKNNRWLVTQLQGKDIDKVIEYAEGGQPKFEIED